MNPLLTSSQPIVLSCSPHVSSWLRKEVEELGFVVTAETFTALETTGTFNDAVRLNLNLHSVNHVYLMIKKFRR
jgi:hypothetical protein